ncbi:ATP-dependent RNA helicase RhlE [Mesorhizobium soli]|uniref:DEAD/DEAH box helicase n=1 Tax=Pseudaminobacter soli (ex Li et al. 2025) TaxID=1295366 RepID=UPI002476CF49|nr:DEAD/DEAH box helicase [Mesorhizobium soli]MDH6232877.1 ATP-dependent RNA helicase RhlE [Mesorhizobium soli]
MTIENTAELTGFAKLGIIGPLLKTTAAAGFDQPKPIQAEAIPSLLDGLDVLAIAQTGSGKTAAFSLPILTKIIGLGTKRLPKTARALILAPTRELAVQIEDTIRVLTKGLHVSTALVLGGVSRFSQVKKMAPGVDVLIATPGRLTDLVREGEVNLSDTRFLVLDEADRMLDMGFIHDVKRLAKATHKDRQTALFSATMPEEIAALAEGVMKKPVRIEVAPQGTTAAEIKQSVVLARTKQKRKILSTMLADEAMRQVMVFARTKHGADRVTRDLERDGFEAAVIHGNKSQNARQKALNGFRDGSVRILVATDIAARGIDVPGISHVINFDLPDEAESYVHRIGRTGRNGADGTAITLCDPAENAKLRQVEKIIRMKLPVAADHLGEPDPQSAPRAPGARAPMEAANDRAAPRGEKQQRPQGQKPSRNGFGKKQAAGENGGDKPMSRKPFRGKRKGFGGRKPATRAA